MKGASGVAKTRELRYHDRKGVEPEPPPPPPPPPNAGDAYGPAQPPGPPPRLVGGQLLQTRTRPPPLCLNRRKGAVLGRVRNKSVCT